MKCLWRHRFSAPVFFGAVISAGLAWDTADLLQALMVLINGSCHPDSVQACHSGLEGLRSPAQGRKGSALQRRSKRNHRYGFLAGVIPLRGSTDCAVSDYQSGYSLCPMCVAFQPAHGATAVRNKDRFRYVVFHDTKPPVLMDDGISTGGFGQMMVASGATFSLFGSQIRIVSTFRPRMF